jgi:hypothetical protein
LSFAAITSLFGTRCPAAIARLVIPVIVDTIKRQIAWRVAHIGVEVGERQPALADCDAATAIVYVPLMLGVRAAHAHLGPNVIDPTARLAVRGGVPRLASGFLTGFFATDTAARISVPAQQARFVDLCLPSAITAAEPMYLMVKAAWDAFNYRKPSKALRCEIAKLGHALA